ncbi:N-acetyltransferase family protein [Macrococcus equipercicus]|uniref:N-acetyltransferase family protein n=1 Tax=Macrococcus equipercicus TaxID=69967 RepID=A0ABQ6R8B3_9STAP|nr:GNAT family N-acetyltransferase [Macrococcus equipercicus]KAA1039352.1 N-acetyltransferase family protein [Macrococcus equipercicus]
MAIETKRAVLADLPRIVEIYNSTVASRQVTADTEPVTVESRTAWFNNHSDKRPIFLFLQDGETVGWLSFETFYGRRAYNKTVEVSLYLDEQFRGRGIGQQAVAMMKDIAATLDIETLLAFVFSHNTRALKLFGRNGFEEYGRLPDVAVMDGDKYSLSILGFKLD